MMQVSTRGFRLVMALSAVLMASARADDPPKGDESAAPKPSKEHEMLAKDVGVWDAEMKAFLGGPGAPPMVSRGVETVTMLPGGMWLLSDYKGEFAGAPFHGHGQTGYIPSKKKFVGTWVDSMGPGLSTFEGTFDPKSNSLTMIGSVDDQSTGKPMNERMVTEFKADGSHVFSIFISSELTKGVETKVMEITYTRRK